jgi:hypothetical protein
MGFLLTVALVTMQPGHDAPTPLRHLRCHSEDILGTALNLAITAFCRGGFCASMPKVSSVGVHGLNVSIGDPVCADEIAAAAEGRQDGSSSGECDEDDAPQRPAVLNPAALGPPDCLLVGAGWSFPVHRCTAPLLVSEPALRVCVIAAHRILGEARYAPRCPHRSIDVQSSIYAACPGGLGRSYECLNR